LAAWQAMLQMGSFIGTVVKSDAPRGGRWIIGAGAAVFVTRAFADREVASPQPGLNARLIATIDAGRPEVLSESQLRLANATGGLDLLILWAGWRQDVDSRLHSEVENLLSMSFMRVGWGWRFHRLFREGMDPFTIAHAKSQQIFGVQDGYDAYYRRHPEERGSEARMLFVCSKEDALALPASNASLIFTYREPTLRLGDCAQEILVAALEGRTDEQLAVTLGLKLPTLKKRWAAVFQHIAVVRPDLLPTDHRRHLSTRGPQKRHALLEYLRRHPEELKPAVGGRRRLTIRPFSF
jgi:hypothetical protein